MEIDDNRNMMLIKEAAKAYEDGALIEARDMLAEVVESINAFETAVELAGGV